MKKKKGAAEFFELFKTRVKSTGLERNVSVSVPTATILGTASATHVVTPGKESSPAASLLGPGDGKNVSPESDARPVMPEMPHTGGVKAVSPGERTFTITMNVAALIVLIFISASFAAFGIGVRYGEEMGRREAARLGQEASPDGRDEPTLKTGTTDDLLPSERRPVVSPADPKSGAGRGERKPTDLLRNPGRGVARQPGTAAAEQPDTARASARSAGKSFYTLRLIDYDLDDPHGEYNAKTQVEWLRRNGLEATIRRITRDGKRRIAVCYGEFATQAEAEKEIPRFQRMGRGFGAADAILIEQKQ